jgi:hypothetical protein
MQQPFENYTIAAMPSTGEEKVASSRGASRVAAKVWQVEEK